MTAPTEPYQFITGGPELVGRIEPLWLGLRQHHADLSPHFAAEMRARSFAERAAEMSGKAAALLLEIAVDRAAGRDAAYCLTTITARGLGEIDSLYIDPAHRGKGLGRRLVGSALDWLEDRGAAPVKLIVAAGNESVLDFYQAFGFRLRNLELRLKK